ncbi:MAG: hypothetical protein C4516_00230 [Oxalobacter sp.]|nr:MAG: hypothetical protein C4516_00230 [Oxalobacter sp.]
MQKTPSLLYVLEGQIGLDPELSRCNQCVHVEYIYFTGIVCHASQPRVTGNGQCLEFQAAEAEKTIRK